MSLDEAFLKEAVLERLKDEAVEVVAAALTALQVRGRGLWLTFLMSGVVMSVLLCRCSWPSWSLRTVYHVCCLWCTEPMCPGMRAGQ